MLHFGYKLHSIIDRDYELIIRSKTTTTSLHDFQVDLSEKKYFGTDRGYFLAKSKGYDATKKRGMKEHLLGMSYVLRNKRISSKKAQVERVYVITKKISKAE
jgi:IS5 family transposase